MENIQTIKLSFVNAFLIKTGEQFILTDTGLSLHRDLLVKELEAAGCLPGKLALIILTHGDFDHTGNSSFLRQMYGCRVAIHEADLPMVRDGKRPARKMKGIRTRVFAVIRKLLKRKFTFEKMAPDLFLTDGQNLLEFGLEAKIIHIPGHTAGSIGILTSGGALIAGDTFLNRGRPGTATLVENEDDLRNSYSRLRSQSIKMIYPGHGRPFSIDKISGKF